MFRAEGTRRLTGDLDRWTRRAEVLIPPGTETTTFTASRLFAAVYPEAVRLAGLIASPTWRHLAAGDADQQRQFTAEVGRRRTSTGTSRSSKSTA